VEKETKRMLQRILDTMQEQQSAIRTLQSSITPPTRSSRDGIADRIERIAQEVRGRESFTVEWAALCDRGLATRNSERDEPTG
jgi:signal transduction histidine kinase